MLLLIWGGGCCNRIVAVKSPKKFQYLYSGGMGGTTALTLFVADHSPQHYFYYQYYLSRLVDQDPDLDSPDCCTSDLCQLHQEANSMKDYHVSLLSVPFVLLVIPFRESLYAVL